MDTMFDLVTVITEHVDMEEGNYDAVVIVDSQKFEARYIRREVHIRMIDPKRVNGRLVEPKRIGNAYRLALAEVKARIEALGDDFALVHEALHMVAE